MTDEAEQDMVFLSVLVKPATKQALQALADADDRSLSWVVRRTLEQRVQAGEAAA